MAKVFLDANILIDLYERNLSQTRGFTNHKLHISPLSCHILCYVKKVKTPDTKLDKLLLNLGIIALTPRLLSRSLAGPTDDLEDNIQLHSAVDEKCEYFFTRDKLLLKMAYFGTTHIVESLPPTI